VKRLSDEAGIRISDYRCAAGPEDKPFLERHSGFSISIVREGSFCYTTGGRKHLLGPGSVLLANADVEYSCSHEFGGKDRCTVFEYPAEVLEEIRAAHSRWSSSRGSPFFSRPVLPLLPRIEAMHHMAWSAAQDTGEKIGLEEAAVTLAAAALSALADADDTSLPSRAARDPGINLDRANAASRFLEENYKEPVGLSEAAAAVHLSPYHFLRLFKHEVGLTPHQYLIRVRLRRAINLLRDTSLPVTDVAYEAGFEDLSNFVRTFHRHVGCAPRSFRHGEFLQMSNFLQEPPSRS
jgi:AraC-like DNA-binding protein